MDQIGDVYVNATITFKGKLRGVTLHEMTDAEWIHDIIHCGDYEYEVVQGETYIDNVEQVDDEFYVD